MVFGLPRTGTTALHYLLSVDPQFRYLRSWELRDPVPPPDIATEEAILAVRAKIRRPTFVTSPRSTVLPRTVPFTRWPSTTPS